MPTTFANTIDNNEILAKRSQCDYAGNDIQTTYATKSEVTTGLSGKQDTISDLSDIRAGAEAGATAVQDAELAAGLATKQDTINDLSTIRSGAAAGATALQPSDVAEVAVSGNYADLINKPTIPSGPQLVPAATSADADKVLTVDSQGVPAWAEAQAPISAGDGISISNNVVSAKVDGTTVTVNASGELQAAAAVTVDQTYDPTSTNPQSGTAVAEAVAGVDTGLFEAQYGITPFADIAAAITAKKVVYCKVSPQVGVAFLAYYDIYGYTDDYIEFQYYRSNSDASEADSVFVYDVTRGNVWTTTEHVAQVQPDWDATSGLGEILNKPTIPTVPSAGNMLAVTNNVLDVTTTAGITDVQQVNALPAQTVSTVLYLIPET